MENKTHNQQKKKKPKTNKAQINISENQSDNSSAQAVRLTLINSS